MAKNYILLYIIFTNYVCFTTLEKLKMLRQRPQLPLILL